MEMRDPQTVKYQLFINEDSWRLGLQAPRSSAVSGFFAENMLELPFR